MFSTCKVKPLRLNCSSIFFFQLIVSIPSTHFLSSSHCEFFPILVLHKRFSLHLRAQPMNRLVQQFTTSPDIHPFERFTLRTERTTR